jgi:hypothetical protein
MIVLLSLILVVQLCLCVILWRNTSRLEKYIRRLDVELRMIRKDTSGIKLDLSKRKYKRL